MTIYTGTEGDDDFLITSFVAPGDQFHGLGGQDTLVVLSFASFAFAVLDSIEHLEFQGTASFAVFDLASHPFAGPGNTITGSASPNIVSFITSVGGDFTLPAPTLINWQAMNPAEIVGLVAQTTSAVTLHANEALASAQSLTGGGGNDTLIGHSGLDLLTGGVGNDVLLGLGGDDIIRLANNNLQGTPDYDQSGDVIDGGIGEDIASVSGPVTAGTLSSVEHIQFMAANFQSSGPELTLFTSRNSAFLAGANFVGTVTGIVTLGFDTVDFFDGSGITFEDQVFNGTLVASDLEVFFNFVGNDNTNTIIGTSRGDNINGGGGTDALAGGLGNDKYYVDVQGDLVFEGLDEGNDHVYTTTNFYLHANVESLTLDEGAGDLFGVGNALGNLIIGNSESNLIIGGDGDDDLHGNAGVDSVFGEAGKDTINGGAGVDYLVGGTDNDTIDGGEDADALYGEDGNDYLIGGVGFVTDILVGGAGFDLLDGASGNNDYDRMDGGADDDTYYVDTGDDLTFEASDGGIDTVYANINLSNAGVYLYTNVENLVLVGTTAFGVGNELNNTLTGSASGNWLLGGAGTDTINGKAGNDVLFGEAGGDVFVFDTASGADVIGDFNAAEDTINLDAYNFASFAALQANFVQVGSDGAIDLGGGNLIVLHNVTMAGLNAGDFIL